MELPSAFLRYADLFEKSGFHLYAVGGTSRDILLGIAPSDLDFATDATPEQMKALLMDADYSFERFGSVKVKSDGLSIDFTTFRAEGPYADYRHPSSIAFTKDMKEDSKRRDFTINALYIDNKGKVFDFHKGLKDLKKKRIKFIGNADKRVKEDPLRIIRAERFSLRLGFYFEKKTFKAIRDNYALLSELNPEKVRMEREKK